ncbi:MAG: hypothetical protein H0W33_07460 [Gammaproteobacteria bacterium]|nr:hypothetical protein [Gammaproteobacteria bacterium]
MNAGCAGAQPPAGTGEDRAVPEERNGRQAVTDTQAGPELETLALRIASEHLSVPMNDLEVMQVEPVDWRDSSLGCPQPGMNYMQVITPGHSALVRHAGKIYRVHMANGRGFICERRLEKDVAPKLPLRELTLSQAQLEALARADLARRLGVRNEAISIRQTQPVVWQDAGLGCSVPDAPAAGAASKGYVITLAHKGRAYEYRADLRRVIPCPPIESR